VFPQEIGAFAINTERVHHILGHAHFDLIKQTHFRRVERVVEVKDPGADMFKEGFYHSAKANQIKALEQQVDQFNPAA